MQMKKFESKRFGYSVRKALSLAMNSESSTGIGINFWCKSGGCNIGGRSILNDALKAKKHSKLLHDIKQNMGLSSFTL